jgi:hypothetical protein
METHDCGAMAALSTEIYKMRGVDARPIQLILAFNETTTDAWSALWRDTILEYPWCGKGFAYHEATAVFDDQGQFQIWDPLGRFWLPLEMGAGYESVVAYRVDASSSLKLCAGNSKWVDTVPEEIMSAA